MSSQRPQDGKLSWLASPEQQDRVREENERKQERQLQHFQSLKQQLEHFREATDPNLAVGLGIEGPREHTNYRTQYQQHQPNFDEFREIPDSSQIYNQHRSASRSASHHNNNIDNNRSQSPGVNNNNNNSRSNSAVALQPPGFSAARRSTSQQQHNAQPAATPNMMMMRPPTVVQADGSFRFIVPPSSTSGDQSQQQFQQQRRFPPPQNPNNDNNNSNQDQPIQRVNLKPSTNPDIFQQQQQHQHNNHHQDGSLLQTPHDVSAIHASQHMIMNNNNHQSVGKNLFGGGGGAASSNNNNNNTIIDGNTTSSNNKNGKTVAVEERPAWIGPLDAGTSNSSPSAGVRGTSRRRHRNSGATPNDRHSSVSVSPSRKQKKEQVHLIQDGRRVVFKGTTQQRLTEESLYTGQSKIRFAWKQQQLATDNSDHGGYPVDQQYHYYNNEYSIVTPSGHRQHHHQDPSMITEYPQHDENNSTVVVDESALYNTSHRSHHHHSSAVTSASTPGSKILPASARYLPAEPKVLNLVQGTAIAAEQMRRAKTEGERRTAETLMRRQAFKALHPEVMEWQDKTWKDSLRPGAKSGKGGAENLEDAKTFTVYKKDRPQWRFPARQGPTMKDLREAPLVVDLTLEDLHVTNVEERVMEHMSSQRRDRYISNLAKSAKNSNNNNNNNNNDVSSLLAHKFAVPPTARCDEPPPTPATPEDSMTMTARYHQQQQQVNSFSSAKHREIQKALPPDVSNFLVREPPGLTQHRSASAASSNNINNNHPGPYSKKQWTASPMPSTPKENNHPSHHQNDSSSASSFQQQTLLKAQQQQQNNQKQPTSSAPRSVRDAMASFGNPNKSIREAQQEQEALKIHIENELYQQRFRQLQQQQKEMERLQQSSSKYAVARRGSNNNDTDDQQQQENNSFDLTSRATSLGALSSSLASAHLQAHTLTGAKIRAVVDEDY